MKARLPEPTCPLGYTVSDLESMFTPDQLRRFNWWMRGQTCSVCDGRTYNHDRREYTTTSCCTESLGRAGMWVANTEKTTGHGVVCYTWDVQRFIDGGPIVD